MKNFFAKFKKFEIEELDDLLLHSIEYINSVIVKTTLARYIKKQELKELENMIPKIIFLLSKMKRFGVMNSLFDLLMAKYTSSNDKKADLHLVTDNLARFFKMKIPGKEGEIITSCLQKEGEGEMVKEMNVMEFFAIHNTSSYLAYRDFLNYIGPIDTVNMPGITLCSSLNSEIKKSIAMESEPYFTKKIKKKLVGSFLKKFKKYTEVPEKLLLKEIGGKLSKIPTKMN